MTYYELLGLQPSCTQDDIKKAYRSLAMKHHPDRGGDTAYFQKITEAYNTLSDENKRAEYDLNSNGGPQSFNFGGMGDFQDIFGNIFKFGPGFHAYEQHHNPRKNRDLNIRCQISLKESFTGVELEASYTTLSNKKQTVVINIPPGIDNGQTVRFHGLGDDSIPNLPKGNLNVTVSIRPDPIFQRRGNDVYRILDIDVFEAMLGCAKTIKTIDDKDVTLNIRPGIEPGSEFSMAGRGFTNNNMRHTGNYVVAIRVLMPAITNPELIKKLETLKDEISKVSK